MTDTTDTAALMLKMRTLADRIIDAEGENNNGEVGKIIEMYDAADTTFKAQNILLVLNTFEAERQRADNAHKYGSERDAENESLMLTVGRLRVEIAELKGDQVPVDDLQAEIKALMRTYALVSSPSTMAAAHDAGYAFVKAKGFNRILAALFTAPQKPIVPVWKIKHWREAPCNGVDWAKGWKEGWNACVKQIEAAGGIVKDGE